MIFEGENCWAYDKKLNELKIEKWLANVKRRIFPGFGQLNYLAVNHRAVLHRPDADAFLTLYWMEELEAQIIAAIEKCCWK